MRDARRFQAATVTSALAAFDRKGGRRRYLVADEVGLGKTVVAREIVEAMSRRASGTLVVYYIANGAAVAHQNKPRVVEFLPEAQRKAAVKTPDRLSLITVSHTPQTPVAVYALTPDTSFPRLKRASLSGGRAVERAFIGVLLAVAYPSVLTRLPTDFLRLDARSGWLPALAAAKKRLDSIAPGLALRYRGALRREFAADGASAGSEPLARRLVELAREHPRRFIGRLRRALCLACLIHQPPDIVIMDEFQRYRDLIGGETSDDPLMSQLLKGDGRKPPALLLLSATPYKLFASRWEESRGVQAHNEFFDLVDFLAGAQVRARAQSSFKAFGDTLRQLVKEPAEERQRGVEKAIQLRDDLQGLLSPVIGRTERSAFSAYDALEPHVMPLPTPSTVSDVIAYRHLARSAAPKRRADALAYWSSVPLPAQALGQRYAISRDQTFSPMRGLTGLTRARRDRIATVDWPDAKLRALQAAAPVDSLALPWVAPSLPWWTLGGAWTGCEHETKLLLFSRFKATPPAVTSLMSFGVEARWTDPRGGYEKAYARKRLKLSERPGPVMAAFHPSIWLIRNTDPLSAADRSPKGLRRQIRKQIMAALKTLSIALDRSTVEKRRRRRSIGRLLPGIEQAAGLAGRSADAWASVVSNDRQANAAVTAWRRTPALESVSPREVDDLVTYAIGAPGVVFGRALLRHAPDALDQDVFPSLVGVSWQGLRAYLDNPVLMSAIGGGSPIEGLLCATVTGNLESVLDEHLWTRTQSHQGGAALAADLRSALRLITGGFSFRPLGPGDRIRLRCHAAMPFGEAETAPPPKAGAPIPDIEEENAGPARPDEIRQSFNSPFWPHILATTSVGQEGLDFHTWCARVLHWDLPSNPLDMEQREGRIQRYAGLSIRRRLGALLGADALALSTDGTESPWSKLAGLAEERLTDPAGLSPWWVLPGARVQRHLFHRPFSRDTDRYTLLREQRFIYRLALGQPNQEDLLEILAKSDPGLLAILQSLTLELCPFKHQTDREAL